MSQASKPPRSPAEVQDAFRRLPAVEELLLDPRLNDLEPHTSRELLLEHVRAALEVWRGLIKQGKLAPEEIESKLAAGELVNAILARLARETRRGVLSAVNATGVVLHTGLGRAPVHPEAAQAMAAVAGSYCILEVERESGERNQRDDYLSDLLSRATGAEAGIGVNNCAAAVLLALQTFAGGGRDVLVSRGELVEIGGSFRMPSVMERAGVRLVEVGTTNRTHFADYVAATSERTGLLLKVHASNYRVVGFTAAVSATDLGALGREKQVASCYDLGSGLLELDGATPLSMLGDEPRVREAVQSGVDVVLFSGDKLLGGPQAGLIVGVKERIEQLRKNPIYRAVRLDKVALAGLETTLGLYLNGRADEIPSRARMLLSDEQLRPAAEDLARRLARLPGLSVRVMPERSQPGSGTAPGIFLPTIVVRVERKGDSAAALARALRIGTPPVFARIQDGALLLDPRTLLDGDLDRLERAFLNLA
jgi:L-seryl-tRNA(Ser) seleniumtransferase